MSPFIPPVENMKLTSKYDPKRIHPVLKIVRKHAGVDLINTKIAKAPIFAAAAGTVQLVKTTKDGYGKYIIIRHNLGGQIYESLYAHLDSFSVKQGQTVKQGQQIGVMGNTGIGTGIHLHFELHRGVYLFENYTYPNSFDPWPWIQPYSMRISEAGLALIKKAEGMYTNAYLCPAKVWTVGYGLTKWPNGKAVKKGDKITKAEAEVLLEQQVNEHASAIFDYVKIPLTKNQFDALASFCYNLGKNILKQDQALTHYINAKDWANVTRVMQLYNKASGKVQNGLINRRKDEIALFLKGLEVDDLVFTNTDLKEIYATRHDSKATKELLLASAAKHLNINKKDVAEGDLNAIALEVAVHFAKQNK